MLRIFSKKSVNISKFLINSETLISFVNISDLLIRQNNIFLVIEDEVVSTFRIELDRFYKMSGVFIQMLLHDAEKQDANINAEVSFMENYKALEEIKQFEEEKESNKLLSMNSLMSKMASKLPTLLDKDDNKQLQAEVKKLEFDNDALKKKMGRFCN
jgi:hypothetical protein